ncbi:TlpA family protein disulfide reductase [Aquimarina mytili]|uniref:TlpA family protein disulfide reductase n=1 Tax=Aquimarina mytili TaxID=874423 RepID=A0A937DAD1_9FLAO|nr:TlpA disulfide reductase family protein [Aquimarina mytili]MBL0685900.1 TlpA family protein disulfide reductase [Aquimarina mytili]
MKKLFQYIIFVIIIGGSVFYLFTKYSGVDEGEQAPDFEATLVDGTPFKLSDLEGGYVLLDFWGSWCPPCRKENPKLVKLHQKYSDRLTIVTIALEKDSLSWKKAVKKDGFLWKNQIVNQNRYVMLSSIARKYGVSEIPAKFLISPEGKLLGKLSFKEIDNLFSVTSNY